MRQLSALCHCHCSSHCRLQLHSTQHSTKDFKTHSQVNIISLNQPKPPALILFYCVYPKYISICLVSLAWVCECILFAPLTCRMRNLSALLPNNPHRFCSFVQSSPHAPAPPLQSRTSEFRRRPVTGL